VNATFLWDFGAGSGIADASQEDPGNVVFNNSGTFTVSFTCTDGFGEPDPTPDTLIITVNEPSSESSGGGSGGGGGCFIDTAADN
jgi:PKD repeat protein